jgi:hypothetical protein
MCPLNSSLAQLANFLGRHATDNAASDRSNRSQGETTHNDSSKNSSGCSSLTLALHLAFLVGKGSSFV